MLVLMLHGIVPQGVGGQLIASNCHLATAKCLNCLASKLNHLTKLGHMNHATPISWVGGIRSTNTKEANNQSKVVLVGAGTAG